MSDGELDPSKCSVLVQPGLTQYASEPRKTLQMLCHRSYNYKVHGNNMDRFFYRCFWCMVHRLYCRVECVFFDKFSKWFDAFFAIGRDRGIDQCTKGIIIFAQVSHLRSW